MVVPSTTLLFIFFNFLALLNFTFCAKKKKQPAKNKKKGATGPPDLTNPTNAYEKCSNEPETKGSSDGNKSKDKDKKSLMKLAETQDSSGSKQAPPLPDIEMQETQREDDPSPDKSPSKEQPPLSKETKKVDEPPPKETKSKVDGVKAQYPSTDKNKTVIGKNPIKSDTLADIKSDSKTESLHKPDGEKKETKKDNKVEIDLSDNKK